MLSIAVEQIITNLATQNTTHLLSHGFDGWGIGAQLSCILYFNISWKAAIKVSPRAGVQSEGWTGEGSASKLTRLLASFSAFWAVGLRASVPHWLSARSHLQFLVMWLFLRAVHNMTACFIKDSKGELRIIHRSPFQASIFIFSSPTFTQKVQPTNSNNNASQICLLCTPNAEIQALFFSLQNCFNRFLNPSLWPSGVLVKG